MNTRIPVAPELIGYRMLVSGGGSGIGLACARMFEERGAMVATLDLNPTQASAMMRGFQADVSVGDLVNKAVAAASEWMGGIDVVVNSAGIGAVGTVEEGTEEQWGRLLDVNLMGMVRVTRAALPHLQRSNVAAIVNVASIVAERGYSRRAALSASKGAVQSLSNAMAADYVVQGIRVNCVNPGTVDTPAVARILDDAPDRSTVLSELVARQPIGRLISADEVAEAICFLAGPRSTGICGISLSVDGGATGLRTDPKEGRAASIICPRTDTGLDMENHHHAAR